MHPTLPLFIDNPPGPLPANQSVGALDHHVFNQSTGTWQRTPSHPDFHLHQQFAQHIDPHSQFNMAYAHQQQQQLQQQQQMQQQQQLQQQAQLYHYGQPVQMFNGFVPPSAGGFGPGVWQYQNGIPMGPVGGGMGSGGVGIGLDMNQYAAQGVQGYVQHGVSTIALNSSYDTNTCTYVQASLKYSTSSTGAPRYKFALLQHTSYAQYRQHFLIFHVWQ